MCHRGNPNQRIRRIIFFDDYVSACCVTDCTGMLPTPPQNEAEQDSYLEIYQYEPPVPEKENKK